MVLTFKILDSKNAICAPTNRDYIDSMVNKIDLICTTFDSIIQGEVHRLDFMKIELIRATFDSIIHGPVEKIDSIRTVEKINSIRTVEKTDSIIHNGDTRIRMKINSIIHTTCNRNLGMGLGYRP